jgi:hypothetical protein
MSSELIRENASLISARAKKHGLSVYAMTKQQGYNPDVHRANVDSGISSFVAVDWMGARAIHEQGFKLGHVGHLVQAPKGAVLDLARVQPEVFTVFSFPCFLFDKEALDVRPTVNFDAVLEAVRHFTQVFRKAFQVTPTEYRMALQQGEEGKS